MVVFFTSGSLPHFFEDAGHDVLARVNNIAAFIYLLKCLFNERINWVNLDWMVDLRAWRFSVLEIYLGIEP